MSLPDFIFDRVTADIRQQMAGIAALTDQLARQRLTPDAQTCVAGVAEAAESVRRVLTAALDLRAVTSEGLPVLFIKDLPPASSVENANEATTSFTWSSTSGTFSRETPNPRKSGVKWNVASTMVLTGQLQFRLGGGGLTAPVTPTIALDYLF